MHVPFDNTTPTMKASNVVAPLRLTPGAAVRGGGRTLETRLPGALLTVRPLNATSVRA